MEVAECRNCHEPGGELISPCECSGSVKWVHRRCLDVWRTVSPNPASFYRCDICHAQYRLRRRRVPTSRRAVFHLKAVRDVLLVLVALVVIIALAGGVMYGFDQATNFTSLFPPAWAATVRNVWFQLFVFGLCLLCFVIGMCGICYGIARCLGCCCEGCCAEPSYRYDTYAYHNVCPPWWWWWWWTPPHVGPVGNCDCDCGSCGGSSCNSSDCNCSGGGGGCDGDAGKAIVIVLAVVIVVIILIGFFVGIALLVYICHRLVRNHLRLLDKEIQAQGLEVIDRATEPDVGPDEVVVDAALLTEPTAPLMEDFNEPHYGKQ